MVIDLRKEFNRVADEFREAYLSDKPSCIDYSDDNTVVPLFNEYAWMMNVRKNNCYNFALDYRDDSYMQPGNLYLRSLKSQERSKVLRERVKAHNKKGSGDGYAEALIKLAEQDGLHYLGTSPKALKDAFPVALFVKGEKDEAQGFHWFALRRRMNTMYADPMGWFHKAGIHPVEDCGKQTIFHFAREDGYRYFAGYFGVNKEEMGIPEDEVAKKLILPVTQPFPKSP